MRRMMLAAFVAAGCFGEEPGPDDPTGSIGVTTVEPEESSSSDSASSGGAVDLYGPCAVLDDCATAPGAEPVECLQGTCVYACSDADEWCPQGESAAGCFQNVNRCLVEIIVDSACHDACWQQCASSSDQQSCADNCILDFPSGDNPCDRCPDGMVGGYAGGCFWEPE